MSLAGVLKIVVAVEIAEGSHCDVNMFTSQQETGRST